MATEIGAMGQRGASVMAMDVHGRQWTTTATVCMSMEGQWVAMATAIDSNGTSMGRQQMWLETSMDVNGH